MLVTDFKGLLGDFLSVIMNYFYLELVTLRLSDNNAFVGVDQYRILTYLIGFTVV